MCGRFSAFTQEEIQQVVADIVARKTRLYLPDWPARPADALPGTNILALESIKAGSEAVQLHWGVDIAGRHLINARLESSYQASWHKAFSTGRVVVPALAYFEPHRSERELLPNGSKRKRQYRFVRACEGGLAPIFIAGVRSGGNVALVTTRPSADLSSIHGRMPFVLEPNELPIWLGKNWDDLPLNRPAQLSFEPENPQASYQAALF